MLNYLHLYILKNKQITIYLNNKFFYCKKDRKLVFAVD